MKSTSKLNLQSEGESKLNEHNNSENIIIPEQDKKLDLIEIPSETSRNDSQKKNSSKKEEEEDDDQNYDTGAKRNLMFEQKDISPFKLYCHLSGKTEIILMVIGFIGAMGSGVAAPLMTFLFGDTFNEFTGVTEELIEFVPEETLKLMFDKFEKNIDKMVKKLLYIGTGMFFAFFISKIYLELCWY